MEIIPAIDLIDGKCVRLFQGDYEKVSHYPYSPPVSYTHLESAFVIDKKISRVFISSKNKDFLKKMCIRDRLDKKEFREEIEGKEEPEIDAENGFEDIEKEEEFNSGSINELQKESKKNYALKIIVQKIENLVKNGSNNIINNKSHEQDVCLLYTSRCV